MKLTWWFNLKQWQKLGLICGAFVWLLIGIGYSVSEQIAEDRAEREEQAAIVSREREVQVLFDGIEINHGYRPEVIEWGGKPMLLMIDAAWLEMSAAENSVVKDWMFDQYQSRYLISVGKKMSNGSISVDRQVYPVE